MGGFTLIEMLVVLVIISLTTTLLIEGLGTTWRNFDKLNGQQLSVNKSLLPKKWFIDSFKGAQLFHPLKAAFTGNSKSMSFTTIYPPGALVPTPSKLTWSIEIKNSTSQEMYFSIDGGKKVKVADLNGQYNFTYLNESKWSNSYEPREAKLPRAIKIVDGDEQWVFCTPGRDIITTVPTSIAINGTHEI